MQRTISTRKHLEILGNFRFLLYEIALLWFGLLPHAAFGVAFKPHLNLSYTDFFTLVMDDPHAMALWTREQLNPAGGQLSPQVKAKLIAVYGGTCYELRCVDDPWFNEKVVREALAVASTGTDNFLTMRLLLLLDYLTTNDSSELEVRAHLQELESKAKALGGGRLLADLYREYSGVFESLGDSTRALSYLQKALDLVQENSVPGDLLPVVLQYDAAVMNAHRGEEKVAQKLYEMPLAFCRKHNIRHYGALMMSNLGRSLIQGSTEDMQKGWSLLDEAEGMIQGMHEPFILGYIHLSKGEAEYKRGHFLPAQDFFQKAHRIYAEAQSMLWQGTSALWMAKAKLGARQPLEVLDWVDRAKTFLGPEKRQDIRDLEEIRSAALRDLGRYQDALNVLEHSLHLRQTIAEEEKRGDVNRLRVELESTVREHQFELLKRDNALKESELQKNAIIRIVALILALLSLCILLLFLRSRSQTKKLQDAHVTIHNILQNIEEGIVTIGPGLAVDANLSPYIHELMGQGDQQDLPHQILQILLARMDLDPSDKQLIQDTLSSCLHASALTWDLNSAHLPMEASIDGGKKILSFDWRPMLNQNQIIDKILLVMRDQTARHDLEKRLSEEQARQTQATRLVHEILQARPQKVQGFIKLFDGQWPQLQKTWESGDLSTLAAALHTIKGEARTLGLKTLTTTTHDLESLLGLHSVRPLSSEIKEAWELWKLCALDYKSILESFDGGFMQKTSRELASLPEIVVEICEGLRSHLSASGLTLSLLQMQDLEFDAEARSPHDLRPFLLHAITNAIDHGFVMPLQRGERIHRDISLAIVARQSATEYQLSVLDNGAGLNIEKLRTKFKEFVLLSEQDLIQKLFEPGVSAADELTEMSGRGIGLHAIAVMAKAWQGRVWLEPRAEGGTALHLVWPKAMRLSQTAS